MRQIITISDGVRVALDDARVTHSTLTNGQRISTGVQEGYSYEQGRQIAALRAFVRDDASGAYLWTSGVFRFSGHGAAYWAEEHRLFHESGQAQRRLFVNEYL